MKFYVARDRSGFLLLFKGKKPVWRKSTVHDWYEAWYGEILTQLDDNEFPEVTFENSPKEIELKIAESNGENDTEENRDIPIGESFEFLGKEYIVKEVSEDEYDKINKDTVRYICDFCAFDGSNQCQKLCCTCHERLDEISVYFVEKE